MIKKKMTSNVSKAKSSKSEKDLAENFNRLKWEWAFTVRVMAILVSAQPPKSAPIVASLVLLK